MAQSFYHIAKEYVETIKEVESTSEVKELQDLEEKRVKLHWQFIELLKQQGIRYKDRDRAASKSLDTNRRPALRIVIHRACRTLDSRPAPRFRRWSVS